MTPILRQRFQAAKTEIKRKSKPSGWVLPKQSTSFSDPDKWSNMDADVTPLERRTWTSFTVLGFWISDAMNAQGWEAASSIIAVGLTWREAVYCIIIGSVIDTIPLVLNGAIGADLHIPFPVAARSSFGFYLARFAVVVRLVTALFWHSIQTYTGSTAITQCIRAIWPSYLDIPNHIPTSVGITSQELISHCLFWSLQFPILLTPPHKLKWFFWFKSVVVIVVSVATVIAMTSKAGGTGAIWDQEYTIHGSKRSWATLSCIMSVTGGWATMATNAPDFTRYLKKRQGDPLTLAAQWDGPGGRCGAFFVGFAWMVAQIGTNLSANVISASNDLTNLFPKYVNIRRGVILVTFIAGWAMVPWKIVYSAASLLNFMTGLSVFLCPIAAMLATDYWLVKRKAIDVPGLYRRHGRYRYQHGVNWRAAVAFLVSVVPNIPGLARSVNASISLSAEIEHVYDMNYLYGFASASFVYWSFSYFFPATETLLPACIYEDVDVIDGVEYKNDGVHTPRRLYKSETASEETKGPYAEVAFTDPEAWNDIYGLQKGRVQNQKDKAACTPPGWEINIVHASDSFHHKLRRIYGPTFTPKAVEEQSGMLLKYANLLIEQLKLASKTDPVVDLSDWYNFTTFDLTGEFAFGEAFHCLEQGQYHFFVKTVFDGTARALQAQQLEHYRLLTLLKPLLPKSAMRPKELMDAYTKELVDRRMARGYEAGKSDVFNYLLSSTSKDDELPFAAYYENGITLVVAGSETTSTLLTGTTYFLCRNPEKLRKVQQEVKSSFERDGEITPMTVNDLTYMVAVLSEAMRVFPPTGFGIPRLIASETGQTVAGNWVPKNTRCSIFHQATYRVETNFTRPDEFIPERWLPDAPSEFRADRGEVLQPFMVGPRGCIGKGLAYAEMRLLLAKMLWYFDFELANPEEDWHGSLKAFMVWERNSVRVRLTPLKH